jgi:hypothetical protein
MFRQLLLLLASLFSGKPSSRPAKAIMVDKNFIPKEVQSMGPMWRGLPSEILLDIIIYSMMDSAFYNNSKAIDRNRFDIINNFRPFKNYRLAWKPWSRSTFMKALYSGNDFVFKHEQNQLSRFNNSVPPALPPTVCRGFLRRIQMHVALCDHYDIIIPGDYKATTQVIRSPRELFMYSSSACVLRDLTGTSGFANLEILVLHIYSDFIHGHRDALAVIEKACFVVRARHVSITEESWGAFHCPGVAELITVELVE